MIAPHRDWLRRGWLLAALLAGGLLSALAGAPAAGAEGAGSAWWSVTASPAPTNLPPGEEGQIYITAVNVGDGNVNATGNAVTVTDNLPPGLEAIPGGAKGVAGSLLSAGTIDFKPGAVVCETQATRVTCTFTGPKPLDPFVPLEVFINVKVSIAAVSGEKNEVRVAGGGAPTVVVTRPLTVSSAPTPFGIENYEFTAENEGGSPDTQAGSHPFQLTTSLTMNQLLIPNPSKAVGEKFPKVPAAAALPKDIAVRLPPGLVGNAVSFPKCSEADFSAEVGFDNACPADTALGVASATLLEPEVPPFDNTGGVATTTVPVFNLPPAEGEPARFGFDAYNILVTLDTSVATGEDYAVITSVKGVSEIASLLSSRVTLWGVPGDSRHDQSRGWNCLAGVIGATCASVQTHPAPFLTMPGSCSAPLRSTLFADSWAEPGARLPDGSIDTSDPRWKQAPFESPALGGCSLLPFTPSISARPDTQAGSTPTGLHVNVHVPQQPTETANGLAEATVKDTTVVLPRGVLVSPSAAHNLQACSETNIGFKGRQEFEPEFEPEVFTATFTSTLPEPFCPEASKVGTVRVKTPLLAHELEGAVYLAQQTANPFGSLLALYIVAEDPVSGVLVKLAGRVTLNQGTGQIVSTFENTPNTPFEDFKVDFFGGPTAQLTTPAYCGSYATTASFTPWSGSATAPGTVETASSFPITSNCTTAPNPQPFSPSFQAGTTNNHAGGFTPFSLTIANPDGDQALTGLTMHLPTGLAAMISSVTPCPEPQAANNECGPESLIGRSTAYSGLGGDPFPLPGRVYLTGPYKGAPFGISVVTPAVAGPFNLGDVTVRSTINVDPNTAAVTVTSDPFPTFVPTSSTAGSGAAGAVEGVPAQLKQINVETFGQMPNGKGFQFNPTNCNPLSITGTLSGAQGASVGVASSFQAANCANLPFAPTFNASTQARGSKANGTSLVVKVTSGPGQANIAKTDLSLPIQLPSRLSTIQKACRDSVFEANPFSCPEGSNIGSAVVHTPVLKNPLSGPAFLVSHGNAAFPDVEFVLRGEGITIVLDGKTDIKRGITYSKFDTLPDAPVSSFETILPAGPHSALTTFVPESRNYNVCGLNLIMPTTITGQNGAVVNQHTKVAISGCHVSKKRTRKQLLAKALKACKKKPKNQRSACARQARRRYGASAAKKHK